MAGAHPQLRTVLEKNVEDEQAQPHKRRAAKETADENPQFLQVKPHRAPRRKCFGSETFRVKKLCR